jgi:hypothetical protein
MEMKPHEKSLGHNPLSDVPYQNPGMVLNGKGPGRHPLGDACHTRFFMPTPSTHRMHDPGSNVPYIRSKVLTDHQMS